MAAPKKPANIRRLPIAEIASELQRENNRKESSRVLSATVICRIDMLPFRYDLPVEILLRVISRIATVHKLLDTLFQMSQHLFRLDLGTVGSLLGITLCRSGRSLIEITERIRSGTLRLRCLIITHGIIEIGIHFVFLLLAFKPVVKSTACLGYPFGRLRIGKPCQKTFEKCTHINSFHYLWTPGVLYSKTDIVVIPCRHD